MMMPISPVMMLVMKLIVNCYGHVCYKHPHDVDENVHSFQIVSSSAHPHIMILRR